MSENVVKEKTLILVKKLIKLSKESIKIKGNNNNNIRRLLKRTIAEYAEDEFAIYLYDLLEDKNIKIYINPKINGFRPDIIIVKNSIITDIIEIKINFGWCRNIFSLKNKKDKYASQIHKRYNQLDDVLGKEISVKIDEENSINLKVKNDCRIYYVCTSAENYRHANNDIFDIINDYNDFISKNKKYKDTIKLGIISKEYHNDQIKDDELLGNIDECFKSKHGMNTIIKEIKRKL